jgi:SAM-dependent methyltransferase
MPDNFSAPEFWNTRYASAQTPWDAGGVPPALRRHLAAHPGRGARVLIPGCGSGWEIAAFAAAGCRVTAVDFSPPAVARARRLAGPVLAAGIVEGDFFSHAFADAPFDLVYERTFLCALAPERWPALAARTAELLRPGGMIAGLYFFGEKDDGPPFGLDPEEPSRIFDARFTLVADEPVPPAESLPIFGGRERWQVRRRRETA